MFLPQGGHADVFSFTDSGRRALQPTLDLSSPRKFVCVRDGIEPSEYTTFEALASLLQDGWKGQVKPPGRKRKREDANPHNIPTDYQHGVEHCPKVWWVSHKASTVSRWYLLALLLSPVHKQTVRHFDRISVYESLVTGKSACRKAMKRKFVFTPRADRGASDEDGPLEAPLPSRLQSQESSHADDADAASSESGSTSSSSSSSSRTSSSRPPDVEQAQPLEAPDAPVPATDHEPEPTGAGLVAFGVAAEVTCWNDRFTFVKTYDSGGRHNGWEVTCRGHPRDSSRCTRRRNFSKYGGALNVEKMLKLWCVQARDHATAASHKNKDLCPDAPLDSLPELAEIDAMMSETPPRGRKSLRTT